MFGKTKTVSSEGLLQASAASCLAYVQLHLGEVVDIDVIEESKGIIPPRGSTTEKLLLALKGMNRHQRERIIYNAHDRNSRDLANWWDDYNELLKAKNARERAARGLKRLVASAMRKLSPAERRALGLNT